MDEHKNVILELQVKPGLSSFSAVPEGAADSVQELLEAAKATVPESLVTRTPITLKATAGLRLLPSDQADAILKSVRRLAYLIILSI